MAMKIILVTIGLMYLKVSFTFKDRNEESVDITKEFVAFCFLKVDGTLFKQFS